MLRTSDWFIGPPDFEASRFRDESGGIWVRSGVPLVHRTLLARLTPEESQLFRPSERELVSDINTPNLRVYQKTAAEFARSREGSILALGCGLGKTRTSLYSCRLDHDNGLGLIVAPKVTFDVWRRELRLVYGPDWPVYVVRGRSLAKDPYELQKPGIYLMNPEILFHRWSEFGSHIDFFIGDEAHYYTHGGAQRSRGAHDIATRAKQRIMLTGTPIVRHVMDLHGILRAAAPGAFGSWQSMATWLGVRHTKYGFDLTSEIPADARRKLDSRLSEVMVRMKWEEVSDEVPEITREVTRIDLSYEDRQEYESLATDVRKVLGDRVTWSRLQQAAGLVQVGRLRRFVGMAKAAQVVELVRIVDESVVVWVWHRDVAARIAALLKQFGVPSIVMTGEDSDKDRSAKIAAFQSGKCGVFIATMAVAGVGIDLTRARIAINAELSWTPSDHAQAEARTWRTGQLRPCITYWVIAKSTIEDRVVDVLLRKSTQARDVACASLVEADKLAADEELDALLDRAIDSEDKG